MSELRILVLRQKIHGLDAAEYADALRERLPDAEVTLARTPTEERDALETAKIATGLSLSADELDAADALELFACVFAGTGHLDIDAFVERDVAVTNAAGVHGPNMSEYVIGAMIGHAHGFHRARRQQARREWRSFQTREIGDATATIVGLGNVGTAIAERLATFGTDLIGVRYSPGKGGPMADVYGLDGLHEAVVDADYVILACPLSDETTGLIDGGVFRTMGSKAILVNVARGPVVDTEALLRALRTNAIAGAILDVTDPEPLPADHELWGFENVFITPHNSGHTPRYFERCADILAENAAILADEGDGPLRNQVV